MASQIAVGLYPSCSRPRWCCAHRRVAGATDAEPALRRLVIEGRDAVARAEKAQECDRTLD
jgi:aminopeptidase N